MGACTSRSVTVAAADVVDARPIAKANEPKRDADIHADAQVDAAPATVEPTVEAANCSDIAVVSASDIEWRQTALGVAFVVFDSLVSLIAVEDLGIVIDVAAFVSWIQRNFVVDGAKADLVASWSAASDIATSARAVRSDCPTHRDCALSLQSLCLSTRATLLAAMSAPTSDGASQSVDVVNHLTFFARALSFAADTDDATFVDETVLYENVQRITSA